MSSLGNKFGAKKTGAFAGAMEKGTGCKGGPNDLAKAGPAQGGKPLAKTGASVGAFGTLEGKPTL